MSAPAVPTPQAPVPSWIAAIHEAFQDRNRRPWKEPEPAVDALGLWGDARAVPVLLTALKHASLAAAAARRCELRNPCPFSTSGIAPLSSAARL